MQTPRPRGAPCDGNGLPPTPGCSTPAPRLAQDGAPARAGRPRVTALDRDPVRLSRVQETLNRLQLRAREGGRRARPRVVDGRLFAHLARRAVPPIGIVRRHPDVRWRAAPTMLRRWRGCGRDAPRAVAVWRQAAAAVCGVLVSSARGTHQIDAFMQRTHRRTRCCALSRRSSLPTGEIGAEARPGATAACSTTAFFYALLQSPEPAPATRRRPLLSAAADHSPPVAAIPGFGPAAGVVPAGPIVPTTLRAQSAELASLQTTHVDGALEPSSRSAESAACRRGGEMRGVPVYFVAEHAAARTLVWRDERVARVRAPGAWPTAADRAWRVGLGA